MDVGRVDVVGGFAAEASGVLTAAWAKPAVNYSAEYLRWQFGFPGPLPAVGVAATEGGRAVAFVGAVNRRVAVGGEARDVYLSSFHSAVPGCGGPAAAAVVAGLVKEMGSIGAPVVSFAAPGGLGERMLLTVMRRWGHRELGTCVAYGGVARAGKDGWVAEVATDDGELEKVLEGCRGSECVRGSPTAAQRAHYRADPRGREWVVIRPGPGEAAVGAAVVFRAEVMAADGLKRLATVDSLCFPSPTAEGLAAVVRCAAGLWAGGVSTPAVVFPNLSCLPAEVVRGAGLRPMPGAAGYCAHLFTVVADDPLMRARQTDIEVV